MSKRRLSGYPGYCNAHPGRSIRGAPNMDEMNDTRDTSTTIRVPWGPIPKSSWKKCPVCGYPHCNTELRCARCVKTDAWPCDGKRSKPRSVKLEYLPWLVGEQGKEDG